MCQQAILTFCSSSWLRWRKNFCSIIKLTRDLFVLPLHMSDNRGFAVRSQILWESDLVALSRSVTKLIIKN